MADTLTALGATFLELEEHSEGVLMHAGGAALESSGAGDAADTIVDVAALVPPEVDAAIARLFLGIATHCPTSACLRPASRRGSRNARVPDATRRIYLPNTSPTPEQEPT